MTIEQQPISGPSMMILAAICFAVINSIVQYSSITWHIPSASTAFLQYGFALICTHNKPWYSKRMGMRNLRALFAVIGL